MNIETYVSDDEAIKLETKNPFFWIVSLVHGDKEWGGAVVEQQLITKKPERYEHLVNEIWGDLIQSGEYYATVRQVVCVEEIVYFA